MGERIFNYTSMRSIIKLTTEPIIDLEILKSTYLQLIKKFKTNKKKGLQGPFFLYLELIYTKTIFNINELLK